jgi:oxygen-independent coproporphyrinogen-3 oxidase
LLSGIRDRVALADDCEVTLEANPGAVEAQRFADYRTAGITRLSIGAQSFRREQLVALGRVHDAQAIHKAIELARDAGFDNLNIDLMYGLPRDTISGAIADLERALDFDPEHVSWYQLTLEPNTAFARRPPLLPDDATIEQIEIAGRALLARHGYTRYEVSAYAQPGRRCIHNLNYWQFGDYAGLGAGAHGKITLADGTIERRARRRNPLGYQATAGRSECVTVERLGDAAAIRLEFLMNALRLTDGVPAALLSERTGLTLDPACQPISAAIERGWLADDPQQLVTTPAGFAALNSVLALFA